MKRIVLVLTFLLGTIASASATCTGPAVMHDFPGTSFNMSLATVPDGNCGSNVAIPSWAGGTLGAMANYGTSPGAVLVPGVNAFITNTPTVVQGTPNGGGANAWPVTDAGVVSALITDSATTAHTCSVAGYSLLGCLGQINDSIVTPPTLGSTSGGLSVKTLAALTNTAIAVKASAGQVYSAQCTNNDATHVAYIQIFDVAAASVTMGTTAPKKFVGIPPGQNAGFTFSMVGVQHATAISAGAASTATGGTAPTTAIDCTVDFN